MKSTAPFIGTRIIEGIEYSEVEPLVNKEALFASRWQFKGGLSDDEWIRIKAEKAVPLFEALMAQSRAQDILQPALLYGYFECQRIGNGLVIFGEKRKYRFDFPREAKSPNRCLADFFGDGFVAIQLATAGSRVVKISSEKFKENEYSSAFFLKGLAAEVAEATAVFGQNHIAVELGHKKGDGKRFSPGYPVFPSLFDQKKILEILDAKRVGVSATRTCQLIPEYSTTAFVSFDPNAEHFTP